MNTSDHSATQMAEGVRAIGPACELGEGPLWHPLRKELFWFDIPDGQLYAAGVEGESRPVVNFGEPASAAGWIDENHLVVATASAIRRLDVTSGQHTALFDLEADNPVTRANDGRVGPDGTLWIGTMGRKLESRAGAYYRVNGSGVALLFDEVTIPNATCFSPDGRTAYLADTRRQLIWRWALDDAGHPVGEKQVHINLQSENLNPDGAVCDAEGFLWNAQWGVSQLARYAPDGSLDRIIKLPVSQPTCPAFGGDDFKTLFITSAKEGLSEAQLQAEPMAGKVLAIDVDIAGMAEHRAFATA